MPKFKIETSLFEPVTIEVEGGRTYTSVPLSPFLIREAAKIEEQRKAGTLDETTATTQQVALIFGLESKDVETIDVRILIQILEYATGAMMGGKAGSIAVEATAEKNVSKPEAVSLP
jgi:prolyl-tRNA editing enzyme YbaK/EbsC (Cys-tRNA(Pro) deacylase)